MQPPYFDYRGIISIDANPRDITQYTLQTLVGTSAVTLVFLDGTGAELPNTSSPITVTTAVQTINQLLATAGGAVTALPTGCMGVELYTPNRIKLGYGGTSAGLTAGTGSYRRIPARARLFIGRIRMEAYQVEASEPTLLNGLQTALIELSGTTSATIGLDFTDVNGVVIPLLDTNGAYWPSVTLTLTAGEVAGLAWLLLATKPDATHPITALPTNVGFTRLRVLTGAAGGVPVVGTNQGGLSSGAAGTAANGCNLGYAPTANVPSVLFINDTTTIGN